MSPEEETSFFSSRDETSFNALLKFSLAEFKSSTIIYSSEFIQVGDNETEHINITIVNETIPQSLCGTTITSDTTLDSNLNCNGTAITIGANNTILDCSGYTITGNGTGDGIYSSSKTNLTIKNSTEQNVSKNYSSEKVNATFLIKVFTKQ